MPKIAFILLVHQDPGLVTRLIKRIAHPDAAVWIHLDAKTDDAEFREVFALPGVRIVEPRHRVKWGGIGLVDAMLASLRAVLRSGEGFDRLQFLSGQDYPLQPIGQYIDYVNRHQGFEFIGNRPYEESPATMRRFNGHQLPWLPERIRRQGEFFADRFLPERIFPFAFRIRKGPNWMALTPEAANYALDFSDRHPAYRNYFRGVLGPDEYYFQTLLHNSPFRAAMTNTIFHCIDWSAGGLHPRTFTMSDLQLLSATKHFFARKFNTDSGDILDCLDERAPDTGSFRLDKLISKL